MSTHNCGHISWACELPTENNKREQWQIISSICIYNDSFLTGYYSEYSTQELDLKICKFLISQIQAT